MNLALAWLLLFPQNTQAKHIQPARIDIIAGDNPQEGLLVETSQGFHSTTLDVGPY